MPVDLVTLGAKTNITAMVKQQPKEPPKQQDVQPPAPDTAQAAQAAPQEDTAPPPPDESAVPLPAKPIPLVVPKTKPQPDQKKDKFDINNIMALLDKRAPAASSAPDTKTGPRNIKGFGAQNAMTADLRDSLKSQVEQCWSPPVGAPDSKKLIVDFDLFLNQDGSIAQPPQLMPGLGGCGRERPVCARGRRRGATRDLHMCAL